jgi:hypothetical protein
MKQGQTAFMKANPDASYEEYFKATGGTKQSWYSVKYMMKRRSSKKTKQTLPNHPHISKADYRIAQMELEIANLKHQIVGFRSVISYLENLAGVRSSQ